MSLWLRDRIAAWLSPRAVVLARQRASWGGVRTVDRREHVFSEPPSRRDGAACTAALESELERCGWQAASLAVRISDHFVRYALLPARRGLRTHADWVAYAAHELDARYGAKRAEAIRLTPARAGAARVAAALDCELLQGLRALAMRRCLRIVSLEPNACRVATHFRASLGPDGHLLIAEPDRLTWLDIAGDRWAGVLSVRNDRGDALTALVLSARVRSGSQPPERPVWCWGPIHHASAAHPDRFDFVRLPDPRDALPACTALGLL